MEFKLTSSGKSVSKAYQLNARIPDMQVASITKWVAGARGWRIRERTGPIVSIVGLSVLSQSVKCA